MASSTKASSSKDGVSTAALDPLPRGYATFVYAKSLYKNHKIIASIFLALKDFKTKSDRDGHFLSDDKFSTRNTVLKDTPVENTICDIPSQAIFQRRWV